MILTSLHQRGRTVTSQKERLTQAIRRLFTPCEEGAKTWSEKKKRHSLVRYQKKKIAKHVGDTQKQTAASSLEQESPACACDKALIETHKTCKAGNPLAAAAGI